MLKSWPFKHDKTYQSYLSSTHQFQKNSQHQLKQFYESFPARDFPCRRGKATIVNPWVYDTSAAQSDDRLPTFALTCFPVAFPDFLRARASRSASGKAGNRSRGRTPVLSEREDGIFLLDGLFSFIKTR